MIRTALHVPLAIALLTTTMYGGDRTADAMAALQRREFQAATALAQEGLHETPGNLELWNVLGIARSETGDVRGAAAAFQRGLQSAPDSITLNENLGLLFFRRADYKQAKRYLATAVQAGSQNAGVRYSLAAAQLRSGETAEARKSLRELEADLHNLPEYWLERGRAELPVDAKAAENAFVRAAAWNDAARAAETQGSDEKALAYLLEGRKQRPNDVLTLIHFGEVCIKRDLGPDAIAALTTVRTMEPENQQALFLLARARIATGEWDTARSLFLDFLRRQKRYAPGLYAVAWIDLHLNRREEARTYLALALAASPHYVDALCERAQMAMDDSEPGRPEQDLKTALSVAPENARANLLMGDLLFRAGDLSAARARYERSLRSDPDSSTAHYKLAGVLSREGSLTRAGEERTLAAKLAEESRKQTRTQLRLVAPE